MSLIGPVGSEFPAVIRSRQDAPIPDYPYIRVDIIDTTQTSGWKLGEGVDDDGNTYIENGFKLLLQYTVYGGHAISIAHQLRASFALQSVLDKICLETMGTFEDAQPVINNPQIGETQSLEVAAFNFTFNITDRVVDIETGTFDTIRIEGELKLDEEDPDSLPIIIEVPEP